MATCGTIFYSPFSAGQLFGKRERALLLQFVLRELFLLLRPVSEMAYTPRLFPYDWSVDNGPKHRLEEHAGLLAHAFPRHLNTIREMQQILQKAAVDATTFYVLLEPLLKSCIRDENLLLFLLKNQRAIRQLGGDKCFLLLLPISARAALKKSASSLYRKRKFAALGKQVGQLLDNLESIHA